MAIVEVIESDAALQNLSSVKGGKKWLRVAAYCRVSTDTEDQKYSYESQVSYYKAMIDKKSGWKYAGIYADEGISGTLTAKRQSFLNMIDDCMDGKIDLIVTKSISRFARNTLDVLQNVRRLRDKGVAVLFEEENINTLTMEGEMLLTVLSSVYQQEVENLSAHVKKGLQMKMSRGELVGFHGCLGYDFDKEHQTIKVNAREAEIVKYIYKRFLDGAGTTIISHELTRLGKKNKNGEVKWGPTLIRRVLTNEKYAGDLLLGKSFTVDPISHRRLKNKGECKKFLVHDHHEAIIDRKVFDKVQEIRKIRYQNSRQPKTVGYRMSVSKEYTFSGMIECAMCGSVFTRRLAHAHTPYKKVQWGCMRKAIKGKESCPDSKTIDEAAIQKAFVESYSIICRNNDSVAEELTGFIQEFLESHNLASKVDEIKKNLDTLRSRRNRLIDMRVDDEIEEAAYKNKYQQLNNEIVDLEEDYYKAQKILSQGTEGVKKRIKEIAKALKGPKDLTDFNPDVFEAVVEKVIVGEKKEDGTVDPYKITFIYKTGFNDSLDGNRFKTERRLMAARSSDSIKSDAKTISNNLSQKQNNEVGELSQKGSNEDRWHYGKRRCPEIFCGDHDSQYGQSAIRLDEY